MAAMAARVVTPAAIRVADDSERVLVETKTERDAAAKAIAAKTLAADAELSGMTRPRLSPRNNVEAQFEMPTYRTSPWRTSVSSASRLSSIGVTVSIL